MRKVAKIVGNITSELLAGHDTTPQVVQLLSAYARALRPWATRTCWAMLQSVDTRTRATFQSISAQISEQLRREVKFSPTGLRMQQLLREQTDEIVSLPRRAALRAEKLTLEALVAGGPRAEAIAKLIENSNAVAKSTAIRLARTQVSSAATALTQARAEFIGSEGYVWNAMHDGTTRPEHAALDGKFIYWNSPPTIDGYTAHAGQFANCRCWPRPVLTLE